MNPGVFAIARIGELLAERLLRREEQLRELKLERKLLRDGTNVFNVPQEYFRQHYRMSQELMIELIDMLEPRLERASPLAIPHWMEVLIAIRFFAEGGYQKGVGRDYNHPSHQTTVSVTLNRVIEAILTYRGEIIRFPATPAERDEVEAKFFAASGIRGILASMDGTMIFIVTPNRPGENPQAYWCYKHSYALNVQMLCDMNHVITSIKTGPGSANDQSMWNMCGMKVHMEQLREDENIVAEEGKFYIIGDGGYRPSPILLTPLPRDPPPPENSPMEAYNIALCHTRSVSERTFGILKVVWRCLRRDRVLHYTPKKAEKIMTCCSVLHNFLRLRGYPLPTLGAEDYDTPGPEVPDNEPTRPGDLYEAGLHERFLVIQECFGPRQ